MDVSSEPFLKMTGAHKKMQVINKTDLAEAIGANLKVMKHDACHMHDSGLIKFAQVILSCSLQESCNTLCLD
jgi:Ni2+-binding GTPase involved in maturation of urease and hydrogenase